MSVINALASMQQPANQKMQQSAQYASNAWSNLMNGLVMKRAGDEILDQFISSKGKVKPENLAGIAKKYHLGQDQFGSIVDMLKTSKALDVERKQWSKPHGQFKEDTVWQTDPQGRAYVIQNPEKKSQAQSPTWKQLKDETRNSIKDTLAAAKEITNIQVLIAKAKSQGLSPDEIKELGTRNTAFGRLMAGFAGNKLSQEDIKKIETAGNFQIKVIKDLYPSLKEATEPARSIITHVWTPRGVEPIKPITDTPPTTNIPGT